MKILIFFIRSQTDITEIQTMGMPTAIFVVQSYVAVKNVITAMSLLERFHPYVVFC